MKNLITFEEHLDPQYGEKGMLSWEEYEQGYETFKLGVLIQEARKKQNLQEELAFLVGTTKTIFSALKTTPAIFV